MFEKIKENFLELLFPRACLGCQREKSWLCQDCKAIIDISRFHQKFPNPELNDLYSATQFQGPLLKKLIHKFKYEPLVKELAQPLSSLICDHFQLLDIPPVFLGGRTNFVLVPIPLEKKRLKWRGFNQAEEIARHLSKFLNMPLLDNVLVKNRTTLPQVKLRAEERKQNILGAFACQNKHKIKGRNILLVDDIYTTGSTMKEAARVLKKSGAQKVIGVVVARAAPGQDNI